MINLAGIKCNIFDKRFVVRKKGYMNRHNMSNQFMKFQYAIDLHVTNN